MILADLGSGIPLRLEQIGDRRIFFLHTRLGSGHANLRQPRSHAVLAGDKRGATGGAALLTVVVGEDHPVFGDAVDVWGPIPHQSAGVSADVRLTDIIAPNDDNV